MRRSIVTASLLCLACCTAASAAPRKKVLVIGIDGCRTDALRAARPPHLNRLIREGALAENTSILADRDCGSDTVSGPGWSSILTGVWADKHGVKDNEFRGSNYTDYPHFFKRLKEARPDAVTVSLVSWPPIHEKIMSSADLSRTLLEGKDYAAADARAANAAAKLFAEKDPDALFVYFGNVDETGHRLGFHPRVPEYIAAIGSVDAHVGTVLKALRARPTYPDEDWLVIVATDHGGRGKDHSKGHEFPEVRTVFLIVSGPSAREGKIEEPTAIVDVPATALAHLGVGIDPEWKLDGRPVGLNDDAFSVAPFSADVTIPLGHRCMGILPTKAVRIDDPLEAHGFVLLGGERPVVLLALDWCEVRNGAHDEWRDALAEAAGTTRERVLVCALHQHDAPVADGGAQALLDSVGLEGELYDTRFHAECVGRVTAALRESLKSPRRVTHVGLGRAEVEKVASSRRVVLPDGRVGYDRYSGSGGEAFHRDAPEGEIDPDLRTISFWDGESPVLALHSYATHPMSHYGRGGVSADFVGLARRLRARDDLKVAQVYVSGCSGDVTAGKYNDGTPAMRDVLAGRLHAAMKRAWEGTERFPLESVDFRSTTFELPFHEGPLFTREALTKTLHDPDAKVPDRILAAMGLSSLDRIDRGQAIDLPCLDLGPAQVVLFPGESFVGYQLMAQRMRPDSFVMSVGYGECWPGYVPTQAAFEEGFNHDWRWAGPGSEERIRAALERVLLSGETK